MKLREMSSEPNDTSSSVEGAILMLDSRLAEG
jgi:hypothetical protein